MTKTKGSGGPPQVGGTVAVLTACGPVAGVVVGAVTGDVRAGLAAMVIVPNVAGAGLLVASAVVGKKDK